jgi:phosphatidylglycerophosphate synthase
MSTLPLTRFARVHAFIMLAAASLALAGGDAWPYVTAALVSFVTLVALCRGAHTPSGAFGWANAVTALRFAFASSLGLVPHSVPLWLLGVAVLVVFALDGLDGWVAKRRGESSEFGAFFDMETDAYFVLLVGIVLLQRGRYGAWVLCAGLLRYVYLLTLALVPARGGEEPRSSFGRHAFTSLMLGLSLGMVLGEPFGTVAAALGCGLVTASFVRSFYWSYARPLR